MKKYFFNYSIVLQNFSLLFLLISFACCSQTDSKVCVCAKNEYITTKKTDTIFSFSNQKKIFVCGFKEMKNKQIVYSEFVIGICGEDTLIGFWGALKNCTINKRNDTLWIDEIIWLPVGNKFIDTQTVGKRTRIYFNNNLFFSDSIFNPTIRKYSITEIEEVINEYEKMKSSNGVTAIDIMKKLFVAYISGSDKAKNYFHEIGQGTINSELSELYDELNQLLKIRK